MQLKIVSIIQTVKQFLASEIQEYVTPKIVTHKMVLEIEGEKIDFQVSAPLPMGVHPEIAKIEAELQVFIKTHGLYKGKEEGVAASKFGWLASLVMPVLGYDATLGLSKYYLALFDHDDALDTEEVVPGEQERVNKLMEEVLQDKVPLLESHPSRIKAIKEVFDRYLKPLDASATSFKYFWETLRKYLSSIESEAHFELAVKKESLTESPKAKRVVSESVYEINRPNTSGIYNAFAATCLLLGVDSEKAEKTHADLRNMIDFMVQGASWLNDIVSAAKELSDLKKKFYNLSIQELKKKVTSNIVLIKWRDGKSFTDAVAKTVKKYEKTLKGFYSLKDILTERGAMTDPEVKAIVVALEGWFSGHPVWCGSGRYHKGIPAKWLESPEALLEHGRQLSLQI
jgi:hypothetical protein